MEFVTQNVPQVDGIISAGIRLVRLEVEYGRLCDLTDFTKMYGHEVIEPAWLKIVAARRDLKIAVEELKGKR